jgi:hypothetical protein
VHMDGFHSQVPSRFVCSEVVIGGIVDAQVCIFYI